MSSYLLSDFYSDFVMDTSISGARMSRNSLFEFWRSIPQKGKLEGVIKFVKSKFTHFTITPDGEHELFLFLRNECEKIRNKWNRLSRKLDLFLKTHETWLNEELIFSMFQEPSPKPTGSMGRPKKSFDESSSKSKRRKIKHLLDEYDIQQLSFATQLSVRASGKRDAANLIHEVSTSSPRRATHYKKAKRSNIKEQRPYTAEEALAFFIANNLSVQTYKNIQHEANERGYKLYPCYDIVAKVKKQCYPPIESLTLTDTHAEVQLQALLTHTSTRICKDILGIENLSSSVNYRLLYKWGCDGSSGHSIYKQRFENSEDTDEYMFVISLVPIRLMTENCENKIVWENPRPSSPRFCRIIKFIFKKETNDLIKQECAAIEDQIKTLVPSVINFGNSLTITVKHELILSMIDGKVCNVLAENSSSQRCFICKATSKEMNSENINTKVSDENMYRFGISSLHAYLRTMECLLNIASRKDIEKYQARGKPNQDIVKARRQLVKDGFKKIGLVIDKVIPGYGTSNDGNTARAFFHNYKMTSEITGIDETLIYHLAIILGAMASGYDIDPDKFKSYCDETRDIYLRLYPWYNMPATLHKILVHGSEIIRHCIIPIGQMSEEASEAKNKEIRNVRLGHALKTSRVRTNYDMIKYLLMSSDPYISLLRKLPKKNNIKHYEDVNKLLK